MGPGTPDRPARATRLTFAYDASGIRLIDRQPISRPAPPADEAPAQLTASDIVAELRTAADAATYRRVLPQAIRRDVEVFDPALPGGVRRDPSPPAAGVFTVIVPEDPAADEVVLLGREEPADVPGMADEAGARPVEVGRFRLREGGQAPPEGTGGNV
ncbi:MAG TPA: hypothetical protein VHK06_07685 [Candidatus Limnocylindria bacterium]|nr:hypothetical protein [Candidatus Limnocylindria bacterium]